MHFVQRNTYIELLHWTKESLIITLQGLFKTITSHNNRKLHNNTDLYDTIIIEKKLCRIRIQQFCKSRKFTRLRVGYYSFRTQ